MEPIKCLAVKQSLKINQEGEITPCCIIRHNEFKFTDADSVKIYQQSDWLARVANDMSKGIQPAECQMCWNKESVVPKSYRLYVNATLEQESDNIEFLDLTLGNTCNSDCAMCNGYSSSKIATRVNQDKKLDLFPTGLIKDVKIERSDDKWFNSPEFFEWFKSLAPNLKIIKLRGGEPFLVKNVERWLAWLIDNDYAKNITLHFNTNASILNQDLMFSCVKNFKYTAVGASVDGVNDCFNYIRHGLDWKQIEENLLTFQKYALAFNDKFWVNLICVVQAYNLKYLIDLLDWCEEYKFPIEWIFLDQPAYLDIKNFKDKQQIQQVIDELKSRKTTFQQDTINELINHLNTCLETTSYPQENFISYTNYMNSFRTLKFNTETLEIQ